jgi:hypothetical protein
MTQQLDDV